MLQIPLASMNVFYSIWSLKVIVFSKSLPLLWDSSSCHIVAVFETSVLKEVNILPYLHNTSATLIPKFQNKAIVHFAWQKFHNLFYGYVLPLFTSWLFHAFLYKLIFFEKIKNSVEAYLSILIDNRIFIVWWVFIKRIKLQSTSLNNDNAYVKVLIQSIRFKTKNTESTEISFPQKIGIGRKRRPT